MSTSATSAPAAAGPVRLETEAYTLGIELPTDWQFAPGTHWLLGWIFTKRGELFTDTRCWIDDDCFLGLTGMPRPEIERRERGALGLPHPGILFLLHPRPGAKLLRLEMHTPARGWFEVFRREISVAGEPVNDAPPPRTLPAEWIPELLYTLLKRRKYRPDFDLAREADALALAAAARPLDSLPNPPFYGKLEEPGPVLHTQYHKGIVRGWLIHLEQPIRRIFATTHPMEECDIPYGQFRPDALGFHPGHFTEGKCQFRGQVDVRAKAPNPVAVKLFAELADGSPHLVFAQRMWQSTCDEKEKHFAVFDPAFFLRCVRALRTACTARGVLLPPPRPFWLMVWRAFRAYRQEAPSRRALRRIEAARAAEHRAPPPVAPAAPGRGPHVLLVSHNLNYEGAPFFLLELAQWLAREAGCRLTVLTGQDGPLRDLFAAAGAAIRVVDEQKIYDCETRREYRRAIYGLVRDLGGLRDIDVVYANTAVCFWGVHLAQAARKPVALQIHESASIKRFFDRSLTWPMHGRVRDAFRRAERVVFLAAATRHYYEDLAVNGNFRLIPSWIDLPRIDRFRAAYPRSALRARLGFAPDDLVIANIGTVCERKGQHVFVRTVEHFANCFPEHGRRAKFLLVGGRPGLFQDGIETQLAHFGLRDRVQIVGETRAAYDYYGAADLFVCTSFEESFPRVVLEAMAFEVPIVSTNVHGIPEIVEHGREAWLCDPGEPVEFSLLMNHALAEIAAGRSTAPAARRRVEREFDLRTALPRHAAELLALTRTA